MKKVKSVMFFPTGVTAAFDENGEQIPELQEAWLRLWLKHAESLGYTWTDLDEVKMPDGRNIMLFKTSESDINWGPEIK